MKIVSRWLSPLGFLTITSVVLIMIVVTGCPTPKTLTAAQNEVVKGAIDQATNDISAAQSAGATSGDLSTANQRLAQAQELMADRSEGAYSPEGDQARNKAQEAAARAKIEEAKREITSAGERGATAEGLTGANDKIAEANRKLSTGVEKSIPDDAVADGAQGGFDPASVDFVDARNAAVEAIRLAKEASGVTTPGGRAEAEAAISQAEEDIAFAKEVGVTAADIAPAEAKLAEAKSLFDGESYPEATAAAKEASRLARAAADKTPAARAAAEAAIRQAERDIASARAAGATDGELASAIAKLNEAKSLFDANSFTDAKLAAEEASRLANLARDAAERRAGARDAAADAIRQAEEDIAFAKEAGVTAEDIAPAEAKLAEAKSLFDNQSYPEAQAAAEEASRLARAAADRTPAARAAAEAAISQAEKDIEAAKTAGVADKDIAPAEAKLAEAKSQFEAQSFTNAKLAAEEASSIAKAAIVAIEKLAAEDILAANNAVARAKEAGAEEFSPATLQFAESSLNDAKKAMQDEQYGTASSRAKIATQLAERAIELTADAKAALKNKAVSDTLEAFKAIVRAKDAGAEEFALATLNFARNFADGALADVGADNFNSAITKAAVAIQMANRSIELTADAKAALKNKAVSDTLEAFKAIVRAKDAGAEEFALATLNFARNFADGALADVGADNFNSAITKAAVAIQMANRSIELTADAKAALKRKAVSDTLEAFNAIVKAKDAGAEEFALATLNAARSTADVALAEVEADNFKTAIAKAAIATQLADRARDIAISAIADLEKKAVNDIIAARAALIRAEENGVNEFAPATLNAARSTIDLAAGELRAENFKDAIAKAGIAADLIDRAVDIAVSAVADEIIELKVAIEKAEGIQADKYPPAARSLDEAKSNYDSAIDALIDDDLEIASAHARLGLSWAENAFDTTENDAIVAVADAIRAINNATRSGADQNEVALAQDILSQAEDAFVALRYADAIRLAQQAADIANAAASLVASYTVVPTDSLWKISSYNATNSSKPKIFDDPFMWPLIFNANKEQIKDPDLIFPDQVFAIPRGEDTVEDENNYKVKRGDTLSLIADKVYGDPQKWPEIYEANRDKIRDPDGIFISQFLFIPR